MTYGTWCERSPRHGEARTGFYLFCSPVLLDDVVHEQAWASMSHLDIYRGPMAPLWDHRAQCLVMCGIDLVLLLLLLTFRNTLLSYSLVLIRTITAPGIPVRRNTWSVWPVGGPGFWARWALSLRVRSGLTLSQISLVSAESRIAPIQSIYLSGNERIICVSIIDMV